MTFFLKVRKVIFFGSFVFLIFGLAFVETQTETVFNQKLDRTVAAKGSGAVKIFQEAINKVPENNKKRFVIFIKPGVYKEQIRIPVNKPELLFSALKRWRQKASRGS